MPYCFSCGKLRDTVGGLCLQCRSDEALRRTVATYKAAALQITNQKKDRKEKDNGKGKGR